MIIIGFYEVSLLTYDTDFRQRISACIALEDVELNGKTPESLAAEIAWDVSAAPGFGDKYTYALATGVPNPGRDPAVITDEEILAAVQASLP